MTTELFLDTETTGFSYKVEAIVELAIVDEAGNACINTLVRPPKPIPPEASAIHHITDDMVRSAPTLQELWPEIQALVKGRRVVAYNASYDKRFFPDSLECASEVVCAMHRLAKYLHTTREDPKQAYKPMNLDKAAELIQYQWTGDAHRALADTMAARAVWNWVNQRELPGINIFSGEPGLGGALTNPTEMAFEKGNIQSHYPVKIGAVVYADAEAAYQKFKTADSHENDELMAYLISEKLRQHPILVKHIQKRGGLPFLKNCSHFTQAKTERFQAWEGQGMDSRFIRNLVAGYRLLEKSGIQSELFEATA